jgi:hypothetical protein
MRQSLFAAGHFLPFMFRAVCAAALRGFSRKSRITASGSGSRLAADPVPRDC